MRRPRPQARPPLLKLVLQWSASIAVLVIVALVLRDRFGAISASDVPLPAAWAVVAAVASSVVANELLVRGWLGLVAMGGARLDRRLGRWVWAKSQLARYAVGMAQVASRALVARRHGLAASLGAVTTLLEVVWYTCINAVMVLATIPWWLAGTGLGWAAWTAVLPGIVVVLALVSPTLFLRAAVLLGRIPPLNRIGAFDRVRDLQVTRAQTARLTGLYIGNAVIRLIGFLALFVGVGGTLDDVGRATGAFALGHLIGAIAVFAPGGLGPREGVTAVVLAPGIGSGPVLMLVAATRLLELVAELLYAAVARARTPRDGAAVRGPDADEADRPTPPPSTLGYRIHP